MTKTRIKFNSTNNIKAKLKIQRGGAVHAYFTERCWAHMGRFTPGGASGNLHKLVALTPGKITYLSPYAHYLYIGILYVDPETRSSYARKGITKVPTNKRLNYHTPGTGRNWDKLMWSSQKQQIIKETEEFMKRGHL